MDKNIHINTDYKKKVMKEIKDALEKSKITGCTLETRPFVFTDYLSSLYALYPAYSSLSEIDRAIVDKLSIEYPFDRGYIASVYLRHGSRTKDYLDLLINIVNSTGGV